jgi:hypothetical protein
MGTGGGDVKRPRRKADNSPHGGYTNQYAKMQYVPEYTEFPRAFSAKPEF